MSRKKYDAAVKVGEYKDQEGNMKARWLNVGAVIQTEHGHVLLLDRTFNPAGLPDPENRGNVLISLFAPRERVQGDDRPFVNDDVPF